MTNKIIVDEIDVSECIYALIPKKQCPNKPMPYAKETSCAVCKEKITQHNFCKNNPNCYYKQLKRKEQECENYKRDYDELFAFNNELINDKFHLGIQRNRYKRALDEIEEVCKNGVYDEFRRPLDECSVILGIINKAKECGHVV